MQQSWGESVNNCQQWPYLTLIGCRETYVCQVLSALHISYKQRFGTNDQWQCKAAHTHTRMCTLSLNSPWCPSHHINPPCVHVFKNSPCWWWATPSRGLTPNSIRKDSRWAVGLISAACVLLWLTLTAPLCSDALLKVCAACPGCLCAARGDICCGTAEQIQEQKGMNSF